VYYKFHQHFLLKIKNLSSKINFSIKFWQWIKKKKIYPPDPLPPQIATLKKHFFHVFYNVDFCVCGHLFEDAINFFLECPLYQYNRTSLFNCFNNIVSISIEYILFGCNKISEELNTFNNCSNRYINLFNKLLHFNN
jgi:hypothetical protein